MLEKITNINVDAINKGNALNKLFGGTNNNSYIHQGLIFNNNSPYDNDSKFLSSSRIRWDNQANILYINDKNFINDTSNYVINTSNTLINYIETSSNNIVDNILSHIETTLGIDNTNGIPIASDTRPGIIKVGEGLFMSQDGFLSIMPEAVQITTPTIIPQMNFQDLQQTLVKSIYKKYIFTYNPNRGTTFDTDPLTNVITTSLPIWFRFAEI